MNANVTVIDSATATRTAEFVGTLDAAADFFGGRRNPGARAIALLLVAPVGSEQRRQPEPPSHFSSLVSALQADVVGLMLTAGWGLGMALSAIAGL